MLPRITGRAAEKIKDFGVRGLFWKNTHFLCGLGELCGKHKRKGRKEIFLKFHVRNEIS